MRFKVLYLNDIEVDLSYYEMMREIYLLKIYRSKPNSELSGYYQREFDAYNAYVKLILSERARCSKDFLFSRDTLSFTTRDFASWREDNGF